MNKSVGIGQHVRCMAKPAAERIRAIAELCAMITETVMLRAMTEPVLQPNGRAAITAASAQITNYAEKNLIGIHNQTNGAEVRMKARTRVLNEIMVQLTEVITNALQARITTGCLPSPVKIGRTPLARAIAGPRLDRGRVNHDQR